MRYRATRGTRCGRLLVTLGGFFLIEVRPIEEALREESRYGGVAEA
jgi:hypothetical protein